MAFKEIGIEIEWSGEGVDEIGKDKATGKVHVKVDPKYFRPTEVESLMADSGKSKELLGWERKITFDDLLRIMVDSDMRKAGLEPVGDGDKILAEKFPDRWWNSD